MKIVEGEEVPEADLVNSFVKINPDILRSTVLLLSPDLRNLIELDFFYGFTHHQIANVLSMPLGTVKTNIRKAYGQLSALIVN